MDWPGEGGDQMSEPKAFPLYMCSQYGMDLRDYFAAAALQGLLAKTGFYNPSIEIARDAYHQADRMMEARKEEL